MFDSPFLLYCDPQIHLLMFGGLLIGNMYIKEEILYYTDIYRNI